MDVLGAPIMCFVGHPLTKKNNNSKRMDNLNINIFSIINILGMVQGLAFVTILLIKKSYLIPSNKYFIFLLLICVNVNFMGLLYDTNIPAYNNLVRLLPICSQTLFAPIVYFFIQFLINPDYKIKKWEYGLYGIFIVDFIFRVYATLAYYSGVMENDLDGYIRYCYFRLMGLTIIGIFLFFIVAIYLLFQLKKYTRSLKGKESELRRKNLKYLINSIGGGIFIAIVWLGIALKDVLVNHGSTTNHEWFIWIGITILIYWIGYAIIMQPEIFSFTVKGDNSFTVEGDNISTNAEKAVSPQLKLSDKTEEHYEKLISLMVDKKLYKNPSLSMEELGNAMNLSKGYLSTIINQKEKKNFFEFINGYRIEEVKEKLNDEDYDHYSIVGIAKESGFKSKSTFYAVFKKELGMSPSQYRKEVST